MDFYERLKTVHAVQFLGAFAKLRKATISFVISVRLSVYPSACSPEKLGSQWTDFYANSYLSVFENCS